MSKFTIEDLDSAPAESKPFLEASVKAYGSVPNLHGVMAGSPGLLEGYRKLHELFVNSSFDNDELTVVWQTINVEHGCHYCVPAHTAIAHGMKVDPALTEALRNRAPMPNAKLQTLHDTTLAMVRRRGRLNEAETEAFFAAGYGARQLLEIILGLSQKVMSNYVNAIAETPLDASFAKFAWNDQEEH